MKWNELGEMNCPIARSLSIMGDRWTLLIIRNAFMRTRRFDDFHKQLGITRHLLTERLNRLVEHNILRKVLYQEAPKRYEYKLTEKGLALYPVIMALTAWGNRWMNENKSFPIVTYTHQECGHKTQALMLCQCCGKPLTVRNISPNLEMPDEQYFQSTAP
ncbi:winged helix-turn-helix transcriptional regulator [Acinetobacter rudis]|uniref:Helix-turn-helix domain-containing protein n=1 Tax=Acinetobacter rudis TaxID=632955 RepID=A0AAW8J620_9GAMM|nr:helix-turn-helix domain-containing protein [Acinetobacter rudis]MDQ8934547.1 helix-turn-helix domain-containing protein [Acinetobacter rudis]MDQ8951690.1 helix-turn-helix domain-containing protein [Acinetobacter rudis]MDQ9016883.1 helix-turn-helix domain-containing protein [Acinetobacter rudis]